MEIVKLLPIVFRLVRMSSELRTATRLSQPTIDELKGALPTLIPVLKRLLNFVCCPSCRSSWRVEARAPSTM